MYIVERCPEAKVICQLEWCLGLQEAQLADVKWQQAVFEVLLSYHPFWLALGLETVVGQLLPADTGTQSCVKHELSLIKLGCSALLCPALRCSALLCPALLYSATAHSALLRSALLCLSYAVLLLTSAVNA